MRYLLTLLIGLLCYGCSRQSADVLRKKCTAYLGWFSDPANGMVVQKNRDGISLTCHLTSGLYEELSAADGQFREALKVSKKHDTVPGFSLNFTLKLEGSDAHGFAKMLDPAASGRYIRAELDECFSLVHGNDTLSPVFSHFENHLDIAPVVSFVLGFRLPAAVRHDLYFRFRDKHLDVDETFFFSQSQISRIPKI